MGEEIWTILEVGPFDKSKTEAAQEVVNDIVRDTAQSTTRRRPPPTRG